MNKKIAVIFLTASLALVGLQSPSTAAPKVYPTCASLLKEHPSGIALSRYSKNKGGTLAKQPKVSASIYKANKKLDLDKDGMICERLKKASQAGNASPAPTVSPEPTSPPAPITFDNLDTKWVRSLAYAEIKRGVLASKSFSPNITYVVGPSLSQERLDREKAGMDRAASFFSDIFKPEQAYIGYYTEKDVNWVDDAFCSQAQFCPSGNWPQVSAEIRAQTNCNFAAATKNRFGAPFFHQCLGAGSDGVKNRQTGPHEYFHWVQAEHADMRNTPNWFIEGSADYFGDALGSWDGSDLPKIMDEMQFISSYNWIQQNLCPLAQPTIEKVVNCFKYTYSRPNAPPAPGTRWIPAHVSYYMGSQATEAMIAVKGLDVFFDFLKDLKFGDFDSTFAKHYGLTVDEFYPKVAKYVLEMYSQKR